MSAQGESPNEISAEVHTVIAAAERAAEAIRADADQQARYLLEEARLKADRATAERLELISALTDDLLAHANAVRQGSEQLRGTLAAAITSIEARLRETAPPAPEPEPELEEEQIEDADPDDPEPADDGDERA